MNNTCMIARLTRDAEIRYTQGDKPTTIARFNVACDKDFKKNDGPTADFYNCIAFGKTAEIIEKYAGTKGTQIALEGRFENNNWTDKDGVKHYDMQFNAQRITLLGKKSDNPSSQAAPSGGDDDFMNVPDGIEDGLPFN